MKIKLLSVIAFLALILSGSMSANASIHKYTARYDDRIDPVKLYGENFNIKNITKITTKEVSSYQVIDGKVSNTFDAEVLRVEDDHFVACGIGQAEVIYDDNGTENIINITVNPARLTVFYLAGQSNMEGKVSETCNNAYKESILCEKGQIYETYASRGAGMTALATGIQNVPACMENNAKAFVPESLTSNKSLNGNKLYIPLDVLAKEEYGKTGPDCGLAYQWNQLTEDKVWAVNVAWTGSKSFQWLYGTDFSKRAIAVYSAVNQVRDAEIKAGHYTPGLKLCFWQQGEGDCAYRTSANQYVSNFKNIYTWLKNTCGFTHMGMITIRSSLGSFLDNTDITYTPTRIAENYIGLSNDFSDVYTISNINETWVSNSNVKNYFAKKYSTGKLTYPLRKGASTKLPVTVADVHADIHYTQYGHNENGIDAANNMYKMLYKPQNTVSASFKNVKANTIDSLTLTGATKETLIINANPCYSSKALTLQYNTSAIAYNLQTGEIYPKKGGIYTINALYNNKVVGKVTIKNTENDIPVVSCSSVTNGIKLTWKKSRHTALYYVYRKTTDGYSLIGKTRLKKYIDKKVSNKKTYTYAVRTYSTTTKKFTSWYQDTSFTYIKAPGNFKVKKSGKKAILTWKKIADAKKYIVYYRVGKNGSWKSTTTTSTSYSKSISNKIYYFKVKALLTNGMTSAETSVKRS